VLQILVLVSLKLCLHFNTHRASYLFSTLLILAARIVLRCRRPSKQMKRAWAPRKLLLGRNKGDSGDVAASVQPRIR
jgi:hypothetical protein